MIQAITTKAAKIHASLATAAPATLGTLARLTFGGVLLMYFWASAATKLGDGAFFGLLSPSGAFFQMFPRAMEAASYDISQLSLLQHLIAIAGTWAEFALPLLIVIGLATRLAALGMIGFIIVQSLTDIFGHQAEASTVGAWFDKASDALILDQRAFWMFALISLVMLGAGPLSLDRLIARKAA
jgi:putative oxidoreductase